ncbi:acyl-CoA carboxylase subunit beta [Actinotignum sanguinis]|uniref:Acyl-CoA carboxylase subunit beta n=5 Tax=Actinomycetaceae TaxID=2049 RepID=A0ABZ0RD60_9ACTO|nr:acyl-CoA carboxylase subunit beta [Actinotignum sanguinis]WPJ89859.1 acyl-CoA carboxylase subunit beta [Schaalia turicensis]MDE1553098.1 acyl-CoA carboxylase subunit beta [Actinotignum sanguinis]MDE1565658.1 acyl-CoA carboxylase subunit beta [Actinotignum sanguinis]MDE1576915.1 acyl-CoA carboxylase subunit beta [Actinotignum sanguinis]MDE1643028.1 acyl-CoA carboxylase subunit beta [Actinotignum sanguinis]
MSLTELRSAHEWQTLDHSAQQVDRVRFAEYQNDLARQAEERAAKRQHAHGKKTARERIALLCDEGSFTEIGRFAGGNLGRGFQGAAVVTGIGQVDGQLVAVYAQDFSVSGGTLGEAEGDKIVALMDKALELRIPMVSLLDSGGARIQDGVVALSQYGRIFKKTIAASGIIPQLSVILGPCAGGAVYGPALTDFIIMTRDNAHMFVTGPDVVKATTGEEVSFDDLGGATLHNFQSGVAHYLAANEDDALDYTRTLLTYLPAHCDASLPRWDYEETAADTQCARHLTDLVPASTKQPYDMLDVIANLVDYGEFVQVQEHFSRSIVVGFAALAGQSVGIVANQPLVDAGTLDVDASEKAGRFVQFCDAFHVPVITLVDVPGYRPGTEQEQAGIIRRGAKLIWSYANATTPLVTVVLRKAYGGAYIVMGSKSLGGDLNFAWPGAEIAVLGAEGAVAITGRRRLREAEQNGEDVAAVRQQLIEEYTRDNVNPFLSVERGELDGIIAPEDTRRVLIESLRILATKDCSHPGERRHGNIPM